VLAGSRAHRVATTGKLESLARGVGQGATFGFLDEIMGGLKSTFGDQTYEQARDEYRENDRIAQQANPVTSMVGNVGGSLASSLIPGMGLAKGASFAQELGLGAKLGALAGAGNSEADLTKGDVGGLTKNALEGAAIGGVIGAGARVADSGVRTANQLARSNINRFFDPTINRLAAAGATLKNIKNAGGLEELVPVVEKATKRGIFNKNAGGALPTPKEILTRVESNMDEDVGEMYKLMAAAPTEPLPVEDLWMRLEPKFRMLIDQADPMQRTEAMGLLQKLEQELLDTGGDITKLWELKKYSGGWANWTKDSPLQNQMKKMFNQDLNEVVVDSVADVARQNPALKGLDVLNERYSTMITLRDYLDQVVDKDLFSGGPATYKMADYVRGSAIGAGVGSMLGLPIIGGVAGIGSMAVGATVRSTPGRLARAKIGETLKLSAEGLQQNAQASAAAVAQGAISRTLSGIRSWIQQLNPGLIPPAYAESVKKIMSLPDTAAEREIRMLLPMIDPMLTPSQFSSEFNGKISTPQDRIAATQITKTQGLPPSVASYHISVLNKTGALQGYHYAKAPQDYGDELLQFNERLTSLGY
jgi:hypothetical protein